jgi:hypothetical protein
VLHKPQTLSCSALVADEEGRKGEDEYVCGMRCCIRIILYCDQRLASYLTECGMGSFYFFALGTMSVIEVDRVREGMIDKCVRLSVSLRMTLIFVEVYYTVLSGLAVSRLCRVDLLMGNQNLAVPVCSLPVCGGLTYTRVFIRTICLYACEQVCM